MLVFFQKLYFISIRPYINIDKKLGEQIWQPKIIYHKAKDVQKNNDYEHFHMFKYGSSFNLIKTEIMTLKIPCNFRFENYPFDEHTCDIDFYEARFLARINLNLKVIRYEALYVNQVNESIPIKSSKIPFEILVSIFLDSYNDTGTISLFLKRNSINLLLGSFYIPTGIFATLSIGSYIINPDIVSVQLFRFDYDTPSDLFSSQNRCLAEWDS